MKTKVVNTFDKFVTVKTRIGQDSHGKPFRPPRWNASQ